MSELSPCFEEILEISTINGSHVPQKEVAARELLSGQAELFYIFEIQFHILAELYSCLDYCVFIGAIDLCSPTATI